MPEQPTEPDATRRPWGADEAEPPHTLRDIPWRWPDVLLGLSVPLLFWAVALAVGRPTQLGLPRWAVWVFQLVPEVWMILFPLWAARRRLPAWRPHLPAGWAVVREALVSIPVTISIYLALFVVGVVMSLIFGRQAMETPNVPEQAILAMEGPAELALLVLLIVGVGPLAEELTFRGLLFNALRHRLPVASALILQAAVFGALHTYSPSYMLLAGVIGLGLGLAYQRRKTLLASLFVHVTINFTATTLTLLALALTPVLGVVGQPHEGGLRVETVLPGGAADQAGLRPGDIITAVGGKPIVSTEELRAALRGHLPGEEVELTYRRDGEARAVRAVPQARGLPFGK